MFKCPTCGQTFLQESAYTPHTQKHKQTSIDSWSDEKQIYDISDMPVGLNRELFKVFEKYGIGDRAIISLWKNGQLNSAVRSVTRERELMDILKEWLEQPE
jgi:hypothetical protein